MKEIYDRDYQKGRYSRSIQTIALNHGAVELVQNFIERYEVSNQLCLEVGCGRGAFQDLVPHYVGIDISEIAGESLHSPFVVASATRLPFRDNSFDVVWTVAVLEHVPCPELALQEIRRVLRPGGLLLLAPAWNCRSWAANGYTVRPFSDFDWRGKIVKASIPIRDFVLCRLPGVVLQRVCRLIWYLKERRPTNFYCRELRPNYEDNWTSDSDAINSIDPFEAILWFTSRGDSCLNYPTLDYAFRVRTGGLVFRINKASA